MIILTGASGGLGQELITHLSEMDNVLGLFCNNQPKPLNNPKVNFEKVNFLDLGELEAFVHKWHKSLSRVTLIHGAALKIDALAINYEAADWDKVMGVNLKGLFFLTKALLPIMFDEKWGRIISLASTGAMRGATGTVAYSASKSALLGMSRVFAKEYGRQNITSNVLSLGYFQSGLINNIDESMKNKMKQEIPSKKFGDSKNIAYAIEFIIKSDFTNGAVINIDGGI